MKSEATNETCFSEINFDSVYQFILNKTQKNISKVYVYEGYEIVLQDNSEIAFKQNGYTLSTVNKDFGIFAFPKLSRDNERITLKTNQLFCELVSLAKNQKYEY